MIDKFVVFEAKNDNGRVYVARESRVPALKAFDENVFLSPESERTESEKKAPMCVNEEDIAFINENSSYVEFWHDYLNDRWIGQMKKGFATKETAQMACDELNRILEGK